MGKEKPYENKTHFSRAAGHSLTSVELTRFDRIVLHLHCLYLDHKYCWHLAGVWRELRLR